MNEELYRQWKGTVVVKFEVPTPEFACEGLGMGESLCSCQHSRYMTRVLNRDLQIQLECGIQFCTVYRKITTF